MTQNLDALITEVHTGSTLDGRRKAILFIDEKTNKPGQLAPLTIFLHEKNITATPGYEEGHVLRVRDFGNDADLHRLLTQDFPAWVKNQPSWAQDQKLIDETLPFIPLDRNERKPFAWGRFTRQYATPIVGALSFLSAGAIMAVDILNIRHSKDRIHNIKSGISTVGTGFFLAASALLTGLGFLAARKPSVTELMRTLEPKLQQDPATVNVHAKHSVLERNMNYALNNPWRIATIANVFGVIIKTVGHCIPMNKSIRNPLTMKTIQRVGIDRMEVAALSSSLVSHGLIATANVDQPKDLLGMKSYDDSALAQDALERRYAPISGIFSPFDPANDQGKSGHLNMKAAGYAAMGTTSFFGAKGLMDAIAGYRAKDAIALAARKNAPLLALLPLNLTADYVTTLSTPRTTYAIDELATSAADYIAHKLDMKKANPEEVTRQAYILSELLASDPRVTHSARQLRKAIDARLEFDHGYKMPTRDEEALKEYQHLMDVSPFSESAAKPNATPVGAEPASILSSSPTLLPKTGAPVVPSLQISSASAERFTERLQKLDSVQAV